MYATYKYYGKFDIRLYKLHHNSINILLHNYMNIDECGYM